MACSNSGTFTFSKGSPVEVSSDEEGFRGVWYVGKILETPPSTHEAHIHKQFYLVEYVSLVSEEGSNSKPLTELVESAFIRPVPPPPLHPHNQAEAFQLNDVVDAYYLDGWWVGVVDQVLESDNYSVSFHDPPDLRQFNRSDLRPHFDWINGKWVRPQNDPNQLTSGLGTEMEKECVRRERSEGKKQQMIQQNEVGTDKQKRKDRPRKSLVKDKDCDGAGATVDKTVIKECTTIDFALPTVTEKSTGYQNVSTEKVAELSDAGCGTEKAEVAIVMIPSNMADVVKPTSMCLDELCPPSNVLHSSSSHDRIVNQWKETTGEVVEIEMQCTTNEATSDLMPDENCSIPFVKFSQTSKTNEPMGSFPSAKSTSVLRAVEDMPVFQRMPQKPHFRPLDKYNQMYREGLAIGYMVIFANVVEQTSKLQVNDPRSIFDSISESLIDLESHGFDVKIVRQRLTELQSIKERQEQLQAEMKGFENQITERTHVQTKVMDEFDDVVKELKALEERKEMLMSTKEKNDFEIAALRSSFDALEEDIQNAQLNFKSIAAATW